MSMIECPCCHEEIESRRLSCCSECGEYACGDCLQGGLCPQCAVQKQSGAK